MWYFVGNVVLKTCAFHSVPKMFRETFANENWDIQTINGDRVEPVYPPLQVGDVAARGRFRDKNAASFVSIVCRVSGDPSSGANKELST